MSNVISMYLANVEESLVNVEYDNGVIVPRPNPVGNDQLDQDAIDYLSGGGVVEPYDPYRNISDDGLRENAYLINSILSGQNIDAARTNPEQGVILSPREKRVNDLKRDNRAKSNDKMTVNDDILAVYIDSVYDVRGQSDDIVDTLDRDELIAYDGSKIVWPIWTPPVK